MKISSNINNRFIEIIYVYIFQILKNNIYFLYINILKSLSQIFHAMDSKMTIVPNYCTHHMQFVSFLIAQNAKDKIENKAVLTS